ncbi:MAG TPA: PEP-utilizing enzyme [Ilumatobacteraceae bacterium]|nr:PEP-utilizing enzyme [Ilumatobacteraceae bacterium]
MVMWEAPGPGYWELDRSHFLGGETPLVQYIQANSMPLGLRRVFAELGTPADTLDCQFVNGYMYTRLRPLIAADRPAKSLPPKFVLKAIGRFHPEFRRRTKAAERAQTERPWRKVIADWEHGGRALIESRNLAIQKVDLTELDDPTLIEHAQEVVEHCRASWEYHHWLHGYDLGPIGAFLAGCREWGVEPPEAIPLLEGASPSTVGPMHVLTRLRSAVERSGTVPRTLDDVRAISPDCARDLDKYLEYRGAMMISRYDIDGVTLGEIPDVVVSTILNGVERAVGDGVQHRIEVVRARIPVAHQEDFDSRLEEARGAMNLRDDNGPTTAEWPLGLLRLAMLELGRRMVAAGVAEVEADALELTLEEISMQLLNGGGPGAAELGRRRRHRHELAALDAPLSLGEPEPAPPLELLPKVLADVVRMVQIVIEQLGMGGDRPTEGLRGVGVGDQIVRGRACRADSPEHAIDRLQNGDVLVVPCTTPAYNAVLTLAGAIVTADGGPLSHAAVLARELGISAVVGARGALTEIPDGALIDVDPVAGEVRIVSEA